MKKILMVTYGGGHVNLIKYVYWKLKEKKYGDPQILALTMAPSVLNKKNIPFHTISEYTKLFTNEKEILTHGERLAKREHNENTGIKYEDTVAYMGFGYTDLCHKYGDEKAEELYRRTGRKAFLPIDTMIVILEHLKPDVVVVTDSPRMEKAAAIAANHLNIPVVVINPLPIMEVNLDYGTKICVMNEFAKNYAIENRLASPDKIIITGQPVFEANTKIDDKIVEQLKINLAYKNYNNIIVYLEQPRYKDIPLIETKLMELAQNHPENFYIVKLHPNQDLVPEKSELSNYKKIQDIDLKSLLFLADVLITNSSTSGIEGVLMGKPLIVIGIEDEIVPDYSQYGIALKVTSIQQLPEIIDVCLNRTDEKIFEAMREARNKFKNRENAAENISCVIKELL